MSADGIGYLSAVLLAVVFAVAASVKLRDPRATERSFVDLGVPHPATMTRAVPITEALIAAALITLPPIGALAALGSLAFFTTFLVLRLREGVKAPCACFGTASQAPLSAANIVGNGFLMILAVLALTATRPARPTLVDVAFVALLVAIEIAIHSTVRRRTGATPSRAR